MTKFHIKLPMTNFEEIEKHCEENSAFTRNVIDGFLINYAAKNERLEPEMAAHLKRFKGVVDEIPEQYINFFLSEYIAHRIFRKGGFISKYLNLPRIKSLPKQELQQLEFQSRNPWRFSFANILNNPSNAFFEMEDILSGEQYLLYSPGMQATEHAQQQRLWFNLIAFNGKCWQTFGMIVPFRSFTADDIFFFATELNPQTESEETIMNDIESNPFPFFMLVTGSGIPVVVSRDHEMVICQSTYILDALPSEKLATEFSIAWNKNVYQLKLKMKSDMPHFAIAYYDEKKNELIRTAMTNDGFESLTKALSKAGLNLSNDADIVVSPGMQITAEKILNKKIALNSYEKLFDSVVNEEQSDELKRINHFIELALPFYNEQKEMNIQELAEQAGISMESAISIWEQVRKNTDQPKKRHNP